MLIRLQLYSLVSRRENELNAAIAASSERIAEAARMDGLIMKQLAEDSRAVAIRAWRDGVAMRITATVTLLTLPGTFTAVSCTLIFISLPLLRAS